MIFSTVILLIELTILFFGVAFLVQLLQRRIGARRIQTWMGGKPLIAALKGIIIGFVTPFCTYSAVPMLVGFRQAGVTPAGYVAFLVAAPVLDPVLFGALVIIVGGKAAIIYLMIAFAAALALALIAEAVDISSHLKPISGDNAIVASASVTCAEGSAKTAISGTESACVAADSAPWLDWRSEVPLAAMSAAKLLRSVGPLLLLGVAIGLAISLMLPAETVARITSDNELFAIPIAAAIGTPLYTSTAALIPIADSLQNVGVGIGAIVALTIAGSGANLPEFVLLSRFFSARLISLFFVYVFLVAVVGGFLTQSLVG